MINWRLVPFVRILTALVLGIVLAYFLPIYISTFYTFAIAIIPVAGLTYFTFYQKTYLAKPYFGIVSFLCFIVLGYLNYCSHYTILSPNHFSKFVPLDEEKVMVGNIIEQPSFKNNVKLQLSVTDVNTSGNEWSKVIGNAIVKLPRNKENDLLKYGDRIAIVGKITATKGPLNPNTFDARYYYRTKDIHHQINAGTKQPLILSHDNGNFLFQFAVNFQNKLAEILKSNIPDDEAKSVSLALILGYRAEISDKINSAFADTGAMHVLSVSGLHIALVANLINIAFKRTVKNAKILRMSIFLQLLLIWAFALTTGASPPALRTAFMLTLMRVGSTWRLHSNPFNSLAASAFFLLIFNPLLLWDVGFQLSFLAIGGILFFQPIIYRKIYFPNKVGQFIWESSSVALAAQLTTLPIGLFYFHQFPLYFLLSGIPVILLANVILVLGFLLFAVYPLSTVLASYIGLLLDKIIMMLNAILYFIQHLPFSKIAGIWIDKPMVLLLYAAIVFLAIYLVETKQKFIFATSICFFLACLWQSSSNLFHLSEKKVIVYHSRDSNPIDVVDGASIYSLSSSSDLFKESRAPNEDQNMGASKIIQVTNDNIFEDKNIFYAPDLVLQFYDKRIAFSGINHRCEDEINANYLIVNSVEQPENFYMQHCVKADTVVIEASVPKKYAKEWENYCSKNEIPFHSVSEAGYKIIEL
ncbi:MAG: ComEC/Rec2 family competence protein [Saprospiraceae bacterium]|nr:ComEC/Rec2 family competence protein [Saprospiraceae bacterium]